MGAPHVPPSGAAALSPLAKALAMDRSTVERLCAESLARTLPTRAEIIPFVVGTTEPEPVSSAPGSLEAVARDYLRHPAPRNGYAKELAARHGVNYASLLSKIGLLRQRCL